jgi:signal transduction histidine kinase
VVRRLLHFDRISICTIDLEQRTVKVAWAAGSDRIGRMPGDVFPLCQSDQAQFLQTPSSVFIQTEDIREIEERFPFLLSSFRYGFRSLISIPLVLKDELIGTLNLRSFKVNAYTERDLKIVESIGLQISGAVTNALLFNERKRAEEALREKTEELARSNRDLEQFAYVASHDLQEPLRMVTSYVQLLARRYKGKLDSNADEFIGFALDGATRMWSLINDLLTYSRVGMQGDPLEPTDCEKVLSLSLHNLKVAIEENGAVVTHDALPTAMANRPQLIQLFQNLIENAIKFHGAEPPRVHISASRNGNGWIFSVRDNGIGIAPEYAERIFIIFQRLHGREEYPGTGIGLAICQKIVERHGGRIWVESEVGKGATFYFNLPGSRTE